MPFPNEHAARQKDPAQYEKFRRVHPEGFPDGIDAIFGMKAGEAKSEIQSLRFDRKKWTVEATRKWLKDHGFKTIIEEATPVKVSKSFWNGVL